MEIAALVSGGVDSSVMVPILKERGYNPHIFYIKIGIEGKDDMMDCPSEEDIEITSFIAKKYACSFDIIDLQKEYYERVASYTMDSVRKGLTPNPDVMCNRMIKFGAFEEKMGYQFDRIATGHYARQWYDNEGVSWLGTAVDTFKDQTDFLARITYHQLSKAMFPIGDLPKSEVRRLAEEYKLPSAQRHDSQGICFLGKINYNDYIREYVGEREGDIIELETGKKLGKHKGFWFHTIGQRKGLGLGGGPWFVVNKDTENNLIYVSKGYDPIAQYVNIINLIDVMAMNPSIKLDDNQVIRYKIRHQPDFKTGIIKLNEKGLTIISDEMISGVAAGQFGVIYHATEPIVLGSGVIDS
ncbi:MAG: tRNA 2-thiouridine(34) synthase MnmA [Lentimicrobiaceae bacterium]|nr:tRNA 2-thiouridine(34) synthase MnmA [Lentimicrobiaceae bacterium]